MAFTFSDGGREAAGYKGSANDCVTRAIAIVTGNPYQDVYASVQEIQSKEHRPKTKDGYRRGVPSSPRSGVRKDTTRKVMEKFGGVWTPTMRIGSGCRVHLKSEELPRGRIIANCSGHVVAVIDGQIMDTHDPTRDGTRCVYGYWTFPEISHE